MDNLKVVHKIIGIKQTSKAIQQGIIDKVLVAEDVDKDYVEQLLQLCKEKSIATINVESKKYLGKISGIDVSAAVVGILKQ